MKLILIAFLLITLFLAKSFVFGRCFVFKQKQKPKLLAGYSLFLGVLLVAYFISIISVVGVLLFHHQYFSILLLSFIALTFVIGRKATYEKLRFYSNIQLVMFFASLLATYILVK